MHKKLKKIMIALLAIGAFGSAIPAYSGQTISKKGTELREWTAQNPGKAVVLVLSIAAFCKYGLSMIKARARYDAYHELATEASHSKFIPYL